MPRRIRLPRASMVFRMTVGISGTIMLLVGLGSAYLTFSVRQVLGREGEDGLRREASTLVRRLRTLPTAAAVQGLDGEGGLLVRVVDRSGAVRYETEGMARIVPAQPFRPRETGEQLEPLRGPDGSRLQLLSVPFPGGRVQLVRDFRSEDRRWKAFLDAAVIRYLITCVTAVGVGRILARHGLAPLRHLADQANRIHPETLASRLQLEDAPAELMPLVEALNRSLSRLETAFTRLTALNADMAHELRTPIHSLRLEAERILSQRNLPQATEESLAGMMESLERMSAMISQMLFLAKSEDPSTVIERSDLDVRELLLGVREPFEPLAEESGVRLEVAADPGLRLRGDPTLLRRALHNLVDNAIRYTPKGLAVTLEAKERPDGLVLEVRDPGEGIPPAILPLLGQRFIRSDASRSRKTGGAGLGLAIVQSIARLHGATLAIGSSMGQGTRIRLTFPRT